MGSTNYHAERIRAALARRKNVHELHWTNIHAARSNLVHGRTFSKLNDFFHEVGGISLLGEATRLAHMRKRPVRILEDGPGFGYFIQDWIALLRKAGVKTNVSVLSLSEYPSLNGLKKEGIIQELNMGPAEKYVPKQEQDIIVSVFGSVSYALRDVQKDHLLKLAHSLSRGGVMLAGLGIKPHESPGSSQWSFLQHPFARKVSPEEQLYAIERAFAKRGLVAKFFTFENSDNMPNHLLVVRRPVK